ncbi:MAG: hypothetical protein K2Q24_03230 [Chitinophagaceae bacterium]|jgi:hypothetical protein|nr:hypothetical protein [Chitinophagaceae bacterium]
MKSIEKKIAYSPTIYRLFVVFSTLITIVSFFGSSCIKTGTGEKKYYANWSCGSSTQCASVMGASRGTNGPFCSISDCNAWKQKYIPGNCNCEETAAYSPVRGGTPPGGRSCFKVGDF